MSDSGGGVRALVAGHADFAAGLVSAVVQITGREDVFQAMTNRGLSAQDVERAMRESLTASGAQVVFTDLPAGSCTMAARRLQRERPTLTVVTGVNLATLLDFVFAELPDDTAAAAAVEKGRHALALTGRGAGPGAPGGPRGA